MQWNRSLLVRLIFVNWQMVTKATLAAALVRENERLSALLQKQKDSIWQMHKSDLVELAIAELGMTRTEAGKETVVTLRERIRRQRHDLSAHKDPLKQLPKGLDKMTSEALTAECTKRMISTACPDNRRGSLTRPQMILAIREDVAQRVSLTGAEMEIDDETAAKERGAEWVSVSTPRAQRAKK